VVLPLFGFPASATVKMAEDLEIARVT